MFVAGDDDQSIYSFRFASPEGIQTFRTRYPGEGYHELTDCFRCTTDVLAAAQSLIASFPNPNRIPKSLTSLYESAEPPERGMVCRWRFASAVQEARAITGSCKDLVGAGIPPRELLILISNPRAQLPIAIKALKAANVEYESPREETFLDTNPGRFLLAILRVVCEPNDYVAHRLILGLRPRVGPTTCNGIAGIVVVANLNYRDIFYQLLPPGLFSGRQLSALTDARAICAQVSTWQASDTLAARSAHIIEIVSRTYGQQLVQEWLDLVSYLPPDITLEELRDYIWADTDEQQASLLKAVYERLGLAIPVDGFLPQKVRIMTMHGAKGLSGSVVFIPGLMEEILPGQRRQPYPGLVLESARMLYVSISRARAACILSYAGTRIVYGHFSNQTRSRFLPHLGGRFVDRADGLTGAETSRIAEACHNL